MGQEEDPEGEVVRRLWDPEEVVRHLQGLEVEAVIENQAEAAVRPFQDEEEGQRQRPGQR